MTWTQTTLSIKDANNTTQTVVAYTDGTNYSFAHPLLDNTGAIIAPATAGNQATANTSLAALATAAALSSTSALQTAANTLLAEIESAVTGTLAVSGTVAISGSALPTGAATSALQTTGNTSLASIATAVANIPATPATAALQTTANTSLATIATAIQAAIPAGANVIGGVTIADGSLVSLGAKADAVITNPASSGSLIALIKGLLTGINSLVTGTILAAGNSIIGACFSAANVVAGSSVTRQANTTTYAIGQLISAYATAANVNANPVAIAAARGVNVTTAAVRCRLTKSGTGTGNAYFRVHYWNAPPTVTSGDGGNFSPNMADATYCGSFDVNCTKVGSNGCWGAGNPTDGVAMIFTPAAGTQNLYHLIEARGAYTPVSGEVFTPYLETV